MNLDSTVYTSAALPTGAQKQTRPKGTGSDPSAKTADCRGFGSVAGGGPGGDTRARAWSVVASACARQRLFDARLDVAFGLATDGCQFGND